MYRRMGAALTKMRWTEFLTRFLPPKETGTRPGAERGPFHHRKTRRKHRRGAPPSGRNHLSCGTALGSRPPQGNGPPFQKIHQKRTHHAPRESRHPDQPVRRFLSSKNLRITPVDSHGECLKALGGDPFDLLLVDQRKSRSKTAGLISKVRQTSPDTKIVLFNASKTDGTGSSKAFGADLALTRPLHLESLYTRIFHLMTEDKTSNRMTQ
jgi:hypothetical protein